ncbi:S41 family peptidase [Paenibacillus hexagrammi]|uniref:Activating protease CtpA/B N-terminal domain-containing protein n=1 Tax=Paenibacillus hexagrammi TaxID=2908839 RepID=A0ABY3SJJ1_9BACL|nr:hypothetical protein [Paenibacillus sp. YPD9-1]UJF34214.1 hypothetical protein L0M14_03000 [Paenibacillus sp. YPD9-1]
MSLLYPCTLRSFAAEKSDSSEYRFDEIASLLSNMHISGKSKQELTDAAIKGMVDSLNDPYTAYLDAKQAVEFQQAINQQKVGIGISIQRNDKGVFLAEVFPKSPAEQGGCCQGITWMR